MATRREARLRTPRNNAAMSPPVLQIVNFVFISAPACNSVGSRVDSSQGCWHEEMEGQNSQRGAYYHIDEIVVGEIHGRPIKDEGVCPNVTGYRWKKERYKQSFKCCTRCMQRWECAEHHWGTRKGCLIPCSSKQGVDSSKTCGRARHSVVRWS
jgi:hypothetical protein